MNRRSFIRRVGSAAAGLFVAALGTSGHAGSRPDDGRHVAAPDDGPPVAAAPADGLPDAAPWFFRWRYADGSDARARASLETEAVARARWELSRRYPGVEYRMVSRREELSPTSFEVIVTTFWEPVLDEGRA